MTRTFKAADLFCGAGGSSSGAARFARRLGAVLDLVCVNHWDVAIATHARNHPTARHHCIDLDAARPEELVPGGYLDLLMASPECVFFSRARGGKPVSDQRRMSAWHVQRWASALDIRCILVENVPEFRDWGPLLADGRPDRKQKGLYFEAWIKALWGMGYAVEWRALNAADYGGATTRTRLFVQARKDGKPIRWPAATHSAKGEPGLFESQRRWRAAREIIDWRNPGPSLLGRKRPLSLKTRLRIARGLRRFGGPLAALYVQLLDLPVDAPAEPAFGPVPFIAVCRENNVPKSVDEPLGTITTQPATFLVEPTLEPVTEPFVVMQRFQSMPRGVSRPLPTATSATGGGMYLAQPTAEPFVLSQQGGGVARRVVSPLPTITANGFVRLVTPTIVPYHGRSNPESVEAPLGTVTTRDRFALCSPVVVPYGPRAEARASDDPLPTILTRDRLGVCTPTAEPFVLSRFGEFDPTDTPRAHDVDRPLPTITGSGAGYLVSPFLVPQFGERDGQAARVHDVDDPLPAVTGHGAGALVSPSLQPSTAVDVDPRRLIWIDGTLYLLDIRFRMLQNRELARAMGFDDGEAEYEFTGTTGEVTRQIGNAVEVNTAAALVEAILGETQC